MLLCVRWGEKILICDAGDQRIHDCGKKVGGRFPAFLFWKGLYGLYGHHHHETVGENSRERWGGRPELGKLSSIVPPESHQRFLWMWGEEEKSLRGREEKEGKKNQHTRCVKGGPLFNSRHRKKGMKRRGRD